MGTFMQRIFLSAPVFGAGLCGLVMPCGGQLYNRHFVKAGAMWALLLGLALVLGTTRWIVTVNGMWAWILIGAFVHIGSLVEACIAASRTRDTVSFRVRLPALLMVVLLAGFLWTVKPHRYLLSAQTARVATIANMPAMGVGDLIVMDLAAYRTRKPGYGDMVVFRGMDGTPTVFRVMGMPGDRVGLQDGVLSVNGRPSRLTPVRDLREEGLNVVEYLEEHPSGVQTRLFLNPNIKGTWTPERGKTDVEVPADSYFLLGDFRMYAEDSRLIGMIARSRVLAQAVLLFPDGELRIRKLSSERE